MSEKKALAVGLMVDPGTGEVLSWSREVPADWSADVVAAFLAEKNGDQFPEQILMIENGNLCPDVNEHYNSGKDYNPDS